MSWIQKTVQEVIQTLQTNSQTGLTEKQVHARRAQYGPNVLPEKPRQSWFFVFLRQFQSPLIYILLLAAVIIFFVGHDKLDALVVSGVLLFNAIVGTVQEGRARSILEGLKRFVKTTSVVLRDGEKLFIDSAQLVPGDIILLQEGERVPADARIVVSNSLQIDEAVLTGESTPVEKTTEAIKQDRVVADQNNMVFKGTYILSGSGTAVVVATGVHTEIGKIHQAAETIDTDMPLKREIERLSYWILWFVLVLCVGLFGVGLLVGKGITELLVTLTALFICVIPEGLPVVLTLVLVTGVYALARRNVLVKRMQAVEALGRADAIVIDKTGTLTRNEMVVSKVVADGQLFDVSGVGYFSQGQVTSAGEPVVIAQHPTLRALGKAGILLNRSEISFVPDMNMFDIKGSPTELAMFIFSGKLGLKQQEVEKECTQVYEIPFDASLQYHVLFCSHNGQGVAFISGSPEKIMEQSSLVDQQTREQLAVLLQEGLRVVAVATKTFDLQAVPEETEKDGRSAWFQKLVRSELTFLGLCGIQDSIRPEVADVIKQARAAGIRIIMATGDHKKTAMFVAQHVGIFKNGDQVLEGSEFALLNNGQFMQALPKTTVYARVAPQQKLALVQGLRRQGNIVAMTGDGVNDVPSLAAAHLGIAMGRIGTEAAKQASDMILLDDSFVSIINAIEYGRHIFYTLRRVVLYFFSTNAGEVLVIMFSLFLGLPLPLLAVQILWLNLVTDAFLDTALAAEKKEPGLLHAGKELRTMRVVDWGTVFKMVYMATPMAFFSLLIFSWYTKNGNLLHARSMALVTMAMFQWFNAFNCRSETKSIFQLGLFSNRWLLLALTVVFGLQVLVLHNPFLQRLFKTTPISLSEWALVILVSSSIVVVEELRKWFVRSRRV